MKGEIMATKFETDWITKIGHPAYGAIREMVEALTLDWDRLRELRDDRELWEEGPEYWNHANPDECDELAELEAAAGDCIDEDEARDRIAEYPLSIELGGWWLIGAEPEPTEYRILLATGGPAVRIVGELDANGEPGSASLEVQDWFKPWSEYHSGDSDHDDVLLAYVNCFYLLAS
jgi:hypothetical protein